MITNFGAIFQRILIPLFFLIAIVCRHPANAQFKEGLPDASIQLLKNKTVLFVLPKIEYEYIDDYTDLLSKAWTLTPIKVIKYADLSHYKKDFDKYAYFIFGGLETTTHMQTVSYSNTHYYLTLSILHSQPGKSKAKSDELCRIELYPEMSALSKFSSKNANTELYTNSHFRNFNLPYMLAYLKFVQQNLQQGKNPSIYKSYEDKAMLENLKHDTLYVPENLIYSRNKFTGKESLKDEDFFKSYNGIYKYVSTEELIDIIKNRNESAPVYLFEYILSSTDKYVGVLEIRSGTVVYRRYTPISYNLKEKDLRAILD
jgi:hypothetical protein